MISLPRLVPCFILNFALCSAGSTVDGSKIGGSTEPEAKIIIIGSGAAGIAAASQLAKNNFKNIIILEAENRIGGRIHSVHFGGSIVDLGAEWCTSEKNNIVYQLAGGLNVLKDDPYDNIEYYRSSGKYPNDGFIREIQSLVIKIYKETENVTGYMVDDFRQKRFNETITKIYGNDKRKFTMAYECLNHIQLKIVVWEGAFSWFDVAAQCNTKKRNGRNLGWNGRGYKTILDILTKKYPDPSNELPVYKNVLYKKEVVKVSVNGGLPHVECLDNSTYTGNHVIWTPSLGVLKHRYQYLFEPALPNEKIDVVNALGIAVVVKIFFYFPQPWWPEHVHRFSFIWSKEDRKRASKEFPYGPKIQGHSWILAIESLSTSKFNSNILTVWMCGELVPSIEKLEDDIIVNGTMFLLFKFLGNQYNVTRPEKIVREKWHTNDHFRGAYSYNTLQSHAEGVSQREILSKPLEATDGKPVILFAGEATNPIHFGTVHGAIETGRREADRIINYYKAEN